ncbi:MAG: hypothetical protein KF886_20815 [Candidatus Hydrogenedentes bacterium]|nr:hypothetical protein [Candidatus Hydrogenedentota bacterium]
MMRTALAGLERRYARLHFRTALILECAVICLIAFLIQAACAALFFRDAPVWPDLALFTLGFAAFCGALHYLQYRRQFATARSRRPIGSSGDSEPAKQEE